MRSLKLQSIQEWKDYAKSDDSPLDIPSSPDDVYAGQWKGYRDWLGIVKTTFLPFEEAREFVRSLKLAGMKEWDEYRSSGK
ncbi:hypothetical protein BH23THE1_BH23THE1_35810 [soil metagenome]